MAKKRRRRRRRRGSLGPFLRVLSLLLAAVAIVMALTLFFKVGSVEVTGSSRYTADEIIEVTGVQVGDNLILLDRYHIAQQLYTQLPYITDVQINPKLPDKLLVEVTETRAAMAIKGADSWWFISGSGKLLEAVDSTAAKDYPCIKNAETLEPYAGGRLQLNEEESPITTQRLLELLDAMERRGMIAKLNSIDLGDPTKLVLGYDDRFQVEMFYDADFAFKLDGLLATVAQLEPNEQGVIRMTMDDDTRVHFIQSQ